MNVKITKSNNENFKENKEYEIDYFWNYVKKHLNIHWIMLKPLNEMTKEEIGPFLGSDGNGSIYF